MRYDSQKSFQDAFELAGVSAPGAVCVNICVIHVRITHHLFEVLFVVERFAIWRPTGCEGKFLDIKFERTLDFVKETMA